jgi:hypothetical protein
VKTGLVLVTFALLLGGCEGACASLADRTCARVGEADALCKRLRAVAASPQGADQQACETGNAFIDELEKH